jgi:hypothetical protein
MNTNISTLITGLTSFAVFYGLIAGTIILIGG